MNSFAKSNIQDSISTQNKNQIKVHYGLMSFYYFGLVLGDVFRGVLTTTDQDSILYEYKMPGTFGINYSKLINKRVAIGFEYNYTYARSHRTNAKDILDNKTDKLHFNNVGGLVHVMYIHKRKVQLYGGAEVGISIWSSKSTDNVTNETVKETIIRPNWHLNLIGIDVGKKVGGFLELGVGNRGLINAGLRVGF